MALGGAERQVGRESDGMGPRGMGLALLLGNVSDHKTDRRVVWTSPFHPMTGSAGNERRGVQHGLHTLPWINGPG